MAIWSTSQFGCQVPRPSTNPGRSAILGAATGMRSMMAPALLSRSDAVPALIQLLLQTAAAGELLADKLPALPSRLSPQPLLARLLIGAAAGGILAKRDRRSAAAGALLGGAGALAGAFIGYHARRSLTHDAGLPDLPVALVEDAIAITCARGAVRPRTDG